MQDLTGWFTLEQREPAFKGEHYFGRLSELCDVTDGTRVGQAYYVEDDYIAAEDGGDLRIDEGWVDKDVQELDWKPTHWRPATKLADGTGGSG